MQVESSAFCFAVHRCKSSVGDVQSKETCNKIFVHCWNRWLMHCHQFNSVPHSSAQNLIWEIDDFLLGSKIGHIRSCDMNSHISMDTSHRINKVSLGETRTSQNAFQIIVTWNKTYAEHLSLFINASNSPRLFERIVLQWSSEAHVLYYIKRS